MAVTDNQLSAFAKIISDTVSGTDDVNGASAGDDQTMSFFKTIANTANISDSVINSPHKIIGNSCAIADSGSHRGQGYCDFTYFNEDYVGFSGTF